ISSDNNIVTVDSNGNLKGIAAGTATITGACGDAKNTFNVTVTVTAVVTESYTAIKIEGDSSIQVGATGKITGTTSPTAGGTITWISSDNNIVTVDSNGNLKGIAAGTATITGACGDVKNTFNVTVTAVVTESYTAIKIEGDSTIQVGKTGKVAGITTPQGGSVTWTSSNTDVVTVDGDGKLTGVAAGEATITGTCGNNVSATWEVKVIKDVSGDTTSKLKDKNGAQVYIKDENGQYVEAVYADYYKNVKFYLKKGNTVYSYTGWQTIDGYTYFYDKNGNYVTGEQVIQGAKYSFDSSGRLSSGSGVLGIDVSKWNGNIDWNAVRNSGISYAIIRCGYRGSTTGALIEDPKFRANIQGAQNAGIKVGVYFFTQAVNDVEAVEEASMVLSLIKGYNLALPVFLDVEATSGNSGRADKISVDSRTAVCSAFCQTIQNSGYKAGIYANTEWFNSFINTPSLTSYKIWLAQYAAAPTYARTKIDMWQYSSKGTISGISGNVDMNISYIN
ncbi:MAG: Ig-like domain-containing protein, partial [Lachnospiraceae bacterium]|nr:Ig-like domain-containing protein [Lachnospiraceae bacterium]